MSMKQIEKRLRQLLQQLVGHLAQFGARGHVWKLHMERQSGHDSLGKSSSKLPNLCEFWMGASLFGDEERPKKFDFWVEQGHICFPRATFFPGSLAQFMVFFISTTWEASPKCSTDGMEDDWSGILQEDSSATQLFSIPPFGDGWCWCHHMPLISIDPDFGDYRPSLRRVIDGQGMNAFMYFGPRIFHSLHLNAPRHDTWKKGLPQMDRY